MDSEPKREEQINISYRNTRDLAVSGYHAFATTGSEFARGSALDLIYAVAQKRPDIIIESGLAAGIPKPDLDELVKKWQSGELEKTSVENFLGTLVKHRYYDSSQEKEEDSNLY